jgi:cell wall-associated NlpC family hydrolase
MKRYILKAILALFSVTLPGCLTSNGSVAIKGVPQDSRSYLTPKQQQSRLISSQKQAKLAKKYLTEYFSPWQMTIHHPMVSDAKRDALQELQGFIAHPGYFSDGQEISHEWMNDQVHYMHLENYPTMATKAITVTATYARALPTLKASYHNIHKPGGGYPFDRLQHSLLPPNLPLLIVHKTYDKQWSFVISHITSGWVKTSDIAFVDEAFIQQWQSHDIVTLTHYETPLTLNDASTFTARLGMIFPVTTDMSSQYSILVATREKNHQAVIQTVTVDKKHFSPWPIPATGKNIAAISQEFIDTPYGWGGLSLYRDCSSTMMDILAPFGIWLPRNSQQQAYAGQFISLKNEKNQSKLSLIHEQAKPWLTLINLDGHVMLYLGEKKGRLYVLQNKWAIHTAWSSRSDGRAIIGKTFISPITLGKGYINVPQSDLDRTYGITVLGG